MILQSGNIAIDAYQLRKQLKLRPDEKAEAHHVQAFFDGKPWAVIAEAGGSLSWQGYKRFISSHRTYETAIKTYHGWMREKPALIFFQADGQVLVIESSYASGEARTECMKMKLALHTAGLIPLTEKERNKIICEIDPSKILELGDDRGPDAIWYNAPNGKVYWNRMFEDRAYTAIAPMHDTTTLAAMGDRLMFRHGSVGEKPELFVAPLGVLTTPGWVVGLFEKESVKPPFDGICMSCRIHPVDEHGWCAKCGDYTCLECGVSMNRRDLQRRSAGFQCPECNTQKFD